MSDICKRQPSGCLFLWDSVHLLLRDLLPTVAHPWTLAAGPLQDERPELALGYKSTHSQGFAHCVRISLYARRGAMQNTIKKSRSSKLDAIFSCALRRERDSNPRTREDQQFSRPPHSTTLPTLQYCSLSEGNAKVRIKS